MEDEKRPLLTHTSPELWEKLKPLARQMRHIPTLAEDRLWQRLRNRQLRGMKFRRQWAIERFIVDFFCYEADLIIEVDGSIHDYQPFEDALRQAFLEAQGFHILRFRNEEILTTIEAVLASITEYLDTIK
jgi:very-short-patch-repair endonuclease